MLELACGSGQLSFMLAGRCRSLIATDFSENMIAEARKKDCGSVGGLSFDVKDATATGDGLCRRIKIIFMAKTAGKWAEMHPDLEYCL